MSHQLGMTVIGLVTGTHLIEDIRVAVPHKVAVPITAEQMLRSKDLYRALNQNRIFKIDGGAIHTANQTAVSADPARIAKLEKEIKELRRENTELKRRNVGLQNALLGMNTHLDGVLASLGRIEQGASGGATAPAEVSPELMGLLQQLVSQGGRTVVMAGGKLQTEAVGGDAPMFLPDEIMPKDAEANIQVQKSSGGTSVADAASKLKELRQKNG